MLRTTWISLTLALLLAAPAMPAHAEDAGHIDYRQKVMGAIGADMGAIGDVVKHELPVTSNLAGHAGSLVAHADLIATAFEKQVTAGPTDAKSEIWDDPEGFRRAIATFRAAAVQLTLAAEAEDKGFGGLVRSVGKACGDCHKGYRKPKEESYKNQ